MGLRRLVLFGSGAAAFGLGLRAIQAPRSWQIGDELWLALVLATGAFALVALCGPRSAGGRAAPWLGLAVLVGLVYGHRHDIGDLALRMLQPPARPSATFAISPDAAYRIDAMVDGTAMRFLVDTGASDVVFTLDDAARLGLDPSRLRFSDRMMTGNGVVRAAPVRLGTLTIGPITVHGLDALMTEGDQDVSLLGMRFLQALAEVTIKDGVLTIRQ